ncbi:MFS transporter [Pelagicoccus mobilis]|uniref:MFS transporter n=1 Tax=Pelagicoccus mobilis TaxID=415221 RepID=A0A934VR77_9BACT|nr:MFS transporter [Pelagicoccus mobilis]MBK1877249.1 MFS transporter [Pelagicoccus mobilis]
MKNSTNRRPNERVPTSEKLAYSLGGIGAQFGGWGIGGLAKPVYTLILGVSPTSVGLVLAIMRIWDAILDPLIGWTSDRCSSKFGRRKPFIFVGAVLMGISYPLIWWASQEWSEDTKVLYFTLSLLIFYTSLTTYLVPYHALGTELTPDYAERTRIMAMRSIVMKSATFIIQWIVPFAFFLEREKVFGSVVSSLRSLTVGAGILLAVAGILTAVYSRERYYDLSQKEKAKIPWEAFRILVKDSLFWRLNGIGISAMISGHLTQFLSLYLMVAYVAKGDAAFGTYLIGIGASVAMAIGIVTNIVTMRYLADKFDKLLLIKWSLGFLVCASILKWFLYNPEHPYLSVLIPATQAPAQSLFWVMIAALSPDYLDHHEKVHNKRIEGSFGAFSSWTTKLSSSAAAALSGYILVFTGFEIDQAENQSVSAFVWMRILIIIIPIGLYSVSWILAKHYPFTRDKVDSIAKELTKRRGSID